MDYVVNSQDALNEALKSAASGDNIILQKIDGSYTIRMQDRHYIGGGLHIISSDVSDPALVNTIFLTGSSNVHFSNLEVNSYTYAVSRADWQNDINVTNCANISIIDSVLHGDATEARLTTDSYVAESLATIRNTDSFLFEGNTVSNYNFGLLVLETTNLDISSNNISALQGDAIRMGGVQEVTVSNNNIHDLLGTDSSLNHMDMIQIWSTSTTLVTRDVTIAGNILDAGNGVATQSIFIRNEKVDTQKAPDPDEFYSNIKIENNIIYNGHLHGITVGETDGLAIFHNTLISNEQAKMIVDGGADNVHYDPAINVASAATDVTITGNITSAISAPSNADVTGNYIVDYQNQSADNYVGKVFLDVANGGDASLAELQANPDGPLGGVDIGADLTRFDDTPSQLTPIIVVEKIDGVEQHLLLDAHYTADATGMVSGADAAFKWTFEDGTTLYGQSVAVDFQDPGKHDVVLTVQKGAEIASIDQAVYVTDPVLFDVGVKNGVATDLSHNHIDFTAQNVTDSIHVGYDSTFEVTRNNSQIYSLDQFTLSFDMQRSSPIFGTGPIAFLNNSFGVSLTNSGEISFDLFNSGGEHFQLTSNGANISDTNWHHISVSFDGIDHTIDIYVDGKNTGEAYADGATKNKEYWGIIFGNPWSNSAFTGQINNVSMTLDPYNHERQDDTTHIIQSSGADNGAPIAISPNGPADDGGVNTTPQSDGFNVIDGTDGDDHIDGTDGPDDIHGDAGKDRIYAGGGDDIVHLGDQNWGIADGGGGNDSLHGGDANDMLLGGGGNDVLYGGGGSDTLHGADGNDVLYGGTGRDWLGGDAGDDTLVASDADYNSLSGGDGNDTLNGGSGRDYVFGDDGNDILVGGGGRDDLTGGAGADQFIFAENSGQDRLLDFNPLEDTLILQGLNYQSILQVLAGAFENHGDLIIPLDGADAGFSWPTTDYVRLVGIHAEDLSDANISLVA